MSEPPVQLIETIRVEPGNVLPLLDWHMRRLNRSCRELGFVWPGDTLPGSIQARARDLDPHNTHRLRLLLNADGQYSLETGLLPATPTPVLLSLSPTPLQADLLWLQHKTTRRSWYADAQTWLSQNPRFFDVVFCNPRDEACEGSRTNIYILNSSGDWITPPPACGLLPGVQRQALLDSRAVKEAIITRDELRTAKEIRVSNALRGWIPAIFSERV